VLRKPVAAAWEGSRADRVNKPSPFNNGERNFVKQKQLIIASPKLSIMHFEKTYHQGTKPWLSIIDYYH
jgi:hypothetical protein